VKVVRAVLRGLGGSNLARLPDLGEGNLSLLPDPSPTGCATKRYCGGSRRIGSWNCAHSESNKVVLWRRTGYVRLQQILIISIVDFDLYSEWHDWMLISDGGYSRNHDPHGVPAEGGKKVSP
jgi:hypothetical protein